MLPQTFKENLTKGLQLKVTKYYMINIKRNYKNDSTITEHNGNLEQFLLDSFLKIS